MVPAGGSPDSMRVQERIQALGLTRCRGPWTHGDSDVVENLDEAEDTLSEVESRSPPGRPNDSVRDGHSDVGHVQPSSRCSGKVDVGHSYCIEKPMLS